MPPSVAVAGGGVAGLVAARHLADAGADVVVYEREPEVGGRVRSTRRDGYVLDRGFQVLFTAYPAARRELDYAALDLREFAPGATICRPNHRSVLADPFRAPRELVDSALNPDVTFRDKLRTLRLRRELAGKPADEIFDGPDQSTEAYLRERGFSERFLDSFARPCYGGITLDRRLSTSKKVFEFTFKMLATGTAALPAGGMGAISRQLATRARQAGATLETNAPVESVADEGDGAAVVVRGETVTADAAVVATDPPTARELTGVDGIPTGARGCVTQQFSLPADAWPDTGRRLLLNAHDDEPNHVAPISEVAPEYAPEDRALVSATFLGDRPEGDEELATRTREALAAWYPERVLRELTLERTDRVPYAQFAQPPGIHAELPGVRAPAGRRYLAGEYTGASSINAAMESGRTAARALLADLG